MACRLLKNSYILQARQAIQLEANSNTVMKTRRKSTNSVSTVKFGALRTWRGMLPVGLCFVAVMQWRAYRKYVGPTVPGWEVRLYCALPLRSASRGWGWLAERRVPKFARPYVYGTYAWLFGANVGEAASTDLRDYDSLAEFFARSLRPGARPVDERACVTAPCDGTVLHCGQVVGARVEQVKGVTYSLRSFLTGRGRPDEDQEDEAFSNSLLRGDDEENVLWQCVVYLAPGDYHRFHSPVEWKPSRRTHVPGELLSVSPRVAARVPGLFVLNERAVYAGAWRHGFFSFAAVGATNVGSVRVYFDGDLHTNVRGRDRSPRLADIEDVWLAKGDIVGEFRMGSTVVLIFEAPRSFRFELTPGQRVRVGQTVGYVRSRTHQDHLTMTTAA